MATAILNKAILYLRMIKFSHSVFALPFAFVGALLAAGGIPSVKQVFWIIVAMVSGRSAAMGLNRIIDLRIDAKNPRTKQRELPAGKISLTEAWVFVLMSLGVFVLSARMLNPLCLKLSPLAIGFFVLYPYTKRFTYLSHFVLGLTISGAPLGAWIAIRGSFDWQILPLCVGVVFWLAGFDTLYALQDYEFDRKEGLYSIPAKVGIKRSLQLARAFHLVTFVMLVFTGWVFGLGPAYFIGTTIAGGLLYYEHSLVKEDDLSKLDMAFFNMNGYLSVTVFFFTLVDMLF